MEQVERSLLGQFREQRLAHAVSPRPYGVFELALELGNVGLTPLGGRRPHCDRESRERRLGDRDLALDGGATEVLEQNGLDSATCALVILLARQIDEA
jgi:hypothetical protein